MEATILKKVELVITDIKDAKNVDEVICALHSLAVLLFPLDSNALSGSIGEKYRPKVIEVDVPSSHGRDDWCRVFYQGAAFPTLARVLLYDVASSWLACFPISARKHVYDAFFVSGYATEVVQTLVPCLRQFESGKLENLPVCSNTERLLVICLLQNNGFLQIAKEFAGSWQSEDPDKEQIQPTISRVAQLVTSIPDKARLGAPKSLSSHVFFKQLGSQFIAAAKEWDRNVCCDSANFSKHDVGLLLFLGEVFARICRRGSADVLLSEVVPPILKHVQNVLLAKGDMTVGDTSCQFWGKVLEAITDLFAVERIFEQLLHELAAESASDVEAYWILWIFFHQAWEHQTSIRSILTEKFLLWKVFPYCCLKWILQFAVLKCPPASNALTKGQDTCRLLDTVQRLLSVWSKKEFIQSATLEQQAYITAAIGLSLEEMSREDLDGSKDAMHSILQGVSYRLENPSHLIRKMASGVALVFSRIIDPKNPLYLDDFDNAENIDWEFGLSMPREGSEIESNSREDGGLDNKSTKKKVSEFELVDPDEVIDPITLNSELVEDENEDDASEDSETSSESSLQPYDLADDDIDLKRKFSQLVDVVGALRKSDDADAVESALDVVEKLVRASPDELKYLAGDLARTLVQVRCSDSTIEGEEDSAEEKRQKALVALIATCPFESLDALNKLFYSPNLDVSQRIMILDIMADAVQELADVETIKPKHQPRALISSTSDSHPWYLPNSKGPPGAGAWKEVPATGTLLNWSHSYERELPPKPGQIRKGKTRKWSIQSSYMQDHQVEWSKNKFPQYAAAFMLPAMQGFDKKRHGVDLLGRDFIVLGKLIYVMGVCMKSAAMHPEASALALPLLDMLSSREICHHVEAYVRRSVLFAASCILIALHPSFVASALVDGNSGISRGLEWARTWALHVAESDTDRECYAMAMTCLQLHAEMALQASRVLESTESTLNTKDISLSSDLLRGTLKIPFSNVKY